LWWQSESEEEEERRKERNKKGTQEICNRVKEEGKGSPENTVLN
jgi:hypothetical protein